MVKSALFMLKDPRNKNTNLSHCQVIGRVRAEAPRGRWAVRITGTYNLPPDKEVYVIQNNQKIINNMNMNKYV